MCVMTSLEVHFPLLYSRVTANVEETVTQRLDQWGHTHTHTHTQLTKLRIISLVKEQLIFNSLQLIELPYTYMYTYTYMYISYIHLYNYIPRVVGTSTCHECSNNSVCSKYFTVWTLCQLYCRLRERGKKEGGSVGGEEGAEVRTK